MRFFLPILLLTTGLFLIFFTQCTKEIYFSLPQGPTQLVLLCNPVGGEQLSAFVSVTTPSYQIDTALEQFNPVVVVLQDGQPADTLRPTNGSQTYWKSKMRTEAGRTYFLTVHEPNFSSISGRTSVPANSLLDPVTLDKNTFSATVIDNITTVLRVPIKIKPVDISTSDSLFAFRIKYAKTDKNGNETEEKASFIALGNVFANLHEGPDGVFLVNKKIWSNAIDGNLAFEALLPYSPASTNDMEILLEWRTVSVEYYKYFLSLSRQGDFSLPFSSPDVLYNNIKNGLGNFSGFSRSNYVIPVPIN